eukprot:SAG22_NODE_9835_length_567_cov_1.177350_1_plen_46_part_01
MLAGLGVPPPPDSPGGDIFARAYLGSYGDDDDDAAAAAASDADGAG